MEIKVENLAAFKRHLIYVIRDHIAVNAEHYADVTLGQIIQADASKTDMVSIRVTIDFNGILSQFRKYQEGEIDVI